MIKNILILFLCFPVLTNAQQQITKTMIYDGVSREYIVYIPASYDASKDYPLLFSFHGGAGFANDFIIVNDMRPIADTAAFIAILDFLIGRSISHPSGLTISPLFSVEIILTVIM